MSIMLERASSQILERFNLCFRAFSTTSFDRYRLTVVFAAVLLWCLGFHVEFPGFRPGFPRGTFACFNMAISNLMWKTFSIYACLFRFFYVTLFSV